jgi:hypothetical protein
MIIKILRRLTWKGIFREVFRKINKPNPLPANPTKISVNWSLKVSGLKTPRAKYAARISRTSYTNKMISREVKGLRVFVELTRKNSMKPFQKCTSDHRSKKKYSF